MRLISVTGDVNGYRPLLHEAADEGYITGCYAVRDGTRPSCGGPPLMICFSMPSIARADALFAALHAREVMPGTADFAR